MKNHTTGDGAFFRGGGNAEHPGPTLTNGILCSNESTTSSVSGIWTDGDEVVGGSDLTPLLSAWGTSPEPRQLSLNSTKMCPDTAVIHAQ